MATGLPASYGALPDIWGEGAIFAFSGMDGPTRAASQFVATYGAQPYDLLIHLPRRCTLQIRPRDAGTVCVATGDVVHVETAHGALTLVYSAWHTLIGAVPAGCTVSLVADDGSAASGEVTRTLIDAANHGALALLVGNGRFALAFARNAGAASVRARRALTIDIEDAVRRRCAIYATLPILSDRRHDRLLRKCLSVMRANTLAPEAGLRRHWSTPDRVPHKDMWLWDSVFHSLAMNRIRPRLAWEFLASVLDVQKPDGMIPHQTSVRGWQSTITQPPLLAWGVWENYAALHDKATLRYALPRLERYLEWDLAQRDHNRNGLLEWFIEENERCRSGESGLDNSPRFDDALLVDALDFSTFAAHDMLYTARIAAELGDTERAAHWRQRGAQMAQAVHTMLWDEQAGLYCDRCMDGPLTHVRAVSGFFPLLLNDVPPHRVERLVQALHDPSHFAAAFPVPSVALSHPAWSTDLWRGATWVNTNYLIMLGLRKHGRPGDAAWLAGKTIEHVQKYYEQFGVIFEYYDAKDETPPVACERKGPRRLPYDIRVKMDCIRDYHWSAALTACLLLGSCA